MTKTATLYLQLMHVSQAVLCCYGAYQSYIAITNLRKYEETTKKLAKWSGTAEEQLHKTRTTQTSGALAVSLSYLPFRELIHADAPQILASLVGSVTLAAGGSYLPSWVRFGASPTLLVAVLFARGHIKNYWAPTDGKTVGTRIPLPNLEDYNEAQRKTEDLLQTLEYLEYGWVATSFVAGMIGYS